MAINPRIATPTINIGTISLQPNQSGQVVHEGGEAGLTFPEPVLHLLAIFDFPEELLVGQAEGGGALHHPFLQFVVGPAQGFFGSLALGDYLKDGHKVLWARAIH